MSRVTRVHNTDLTWVVVGDQGKFPLMQRGLDEEAGGAARRPGRQNELRGQQRQRL